MAKLEASAPGKKSHHKHVERALKKGHPLLIHYKKLNGRTVKRKIEPRSWRGNTLVAYDHKRKAVRSFRMERVKHMEKAAFWAGFDKQAELNPHLLHAAELGGLGFLARDVPKHWNSEDPEKRRTARTEGIGLGILAAPSIHHFGSMAVNKLRGAAKAL